MAEPYLGEIRLFAGNYAPYQFAYCNGQLLAISQYEALYSLLGTTYGGDGRSSFALPDFRGRVVMGSGHGPGLTNRVMGSRFGLERVKLSLAQIPIHSHRLQVSRSSANSPNGKDMVLGKTDTPFYTKYDENNYTCKLSSDVIEKVGGNDSHPNIQPYSALNYIISLHGVYPNRN